MRAGYLIAAASGRALARSAARAGIVTHVIDLFADADTRQYCASATSLDAGLDSQALVAAADAIDPRHELPVVYGGGFEGCPHRLRALCKRRTLSGNRPQLLERLSRPTLIADTLAGIDIPHPEVRQDRPTDARGWLIKRAGRAGGAHVREAATGPALAGEYYQRRLDGRTLSVTLLADGTSARVLGYAEQWPDLAAATRPPPVAPPNFRFGGAVSLRAKSLPVRLHEALCGAATKLSSTFGLRGLCSFDVIAHGEDWALIDINARPGFCFELHEAALAPGASLFRLHCLATQGQLSDRPRRSTQHQHAHAVVYAHRSVALPVEPIDWPSWTTDRPCGAQRIAAGEPVCTVHAAAATADEARETVMTRHTSIQDAIGLFADCGGAAGAPELEVCPAIHPAPAPQLAGRGANA